jgi:SAM-dependent methyltransferase
MGEFEAMSRRRHPPGNAARVLRSVRARVRKRLVKLRLDLLGAIPPRRRNAFVARLPRWLVPAEMRAYDPFYWERLYGSVDPFGFDRSPEESLKFERTLELCGNGRFGRALEIGCSEGAFTERLAPRCESLLAVDISGLAIERARERLHALEHVRLEVRALPVDFPDGPFDLIVASDVFYYWPIEDVVSIVPRIEQALAPGGTFVVLHYVPRMGSLINGDEVHDALVQHMRLEHPESERREFGAGRLYRIDRFVKLGVS